MRLGQLARQLEIKPDRIVTFLDKEKGITMKSHPNCKVQDELIEDITNHFNPVAESDSEVAATEEVKKEAPEKDVVAPVEHIETQKIEKPQELKIIGKIDLPNRKEITVEVDGVVYDQATLDEKKKEELKAEREKKAIEKAARKAEEDEKRKLAKEQRAVEAERKAMLETEKSNKLSKEAEKAKALVLKAQKEREDKLEKKRKLKQASHYKKNFNKIAPIKKKIVSSTPQNNKVEPTEQVTTETATTETAAEIVETSLYKRFVKWLNT